MPHAHYRCSLAYCRTIPVSGTCLYCGGGRPVAEQVGFTENVARTSFDKLSHAGNAARRTILRTREPLLLTASGSSRGKVGGLRRAPARFACLAWYRQTQGLHLSLCLSHCDGATGGGLNTTCNTTFAAHQAASVEGGILPQHHLSCRTTIEHATLYGMFRIANTSRLGGRLKMARARTPLERAALPCAASGALCSMRGSRTLHGKRTLTPA